MKISKKGFLTGIIISDAFTAPVDGLKEGLIKSKIEKKIEYIDNLKTIKGKEYLWKKPGLYTSISQFSILISILSAQRKIDKKTITNTILKNTGIEEFNHGIFRNPGKLFGFFLDRVYSEKELLYQEITKPGSEIILYPSIQYLFFPQSEKINLQSIIDMVFMFTLDSETIISSMVLFELIKKINDSQNYNPANIINDFKNSCENVYKFCHENSSIIFNYGINPDLFINKSENMVKLVKTMINCSDYTSTEKTLLVELNKNEKNNYTRITVDKPMIVLCNAVSLLYFNIKNPSEKTIDIAFNGGSSLFLNVIYSSLAGFINGDSIFPENLKNNLVNKKRIFSIIESVANNKISDNILDEYIKSESQLTVKNLEEYNSRQKNKKTAQPQKTKKYQSPEERLNKHVVESWTKLDKAKWKKEKRKIKN